MNLRLREGVKVRAAPRYIWQLGELSLHFPKAGRMRTLLFYISIDVIIALHSRVVAF